MKTVQAIIDLFGGLPHLHNNPIKIEVAGFMPLSIEFIGTGPRDLPLLSVMHFYEQQGNFRTPDLSKSLDWRRGRLSVAGKGFAPEGG
jgi:hypothetical protein